MIKKLEDLRDMVKSHIFLLMIKDFLQEYKQKMYKISMVLIYCIYWDFPGGSVSKASAYDAGDPGSIPGSGRSSGEGNGNLPQYSCLENPMDGGAW